MKQLKVYYAKLNNMGDLLNEYIIPMVTGCEVVHCEKVNQFSVMGIGSCGGAVWGGKEDGLAGKMKDAAKRTMCLTSSAPCAVWGTGFLKDFGDRKLSLLRPSVRFIAVRGAKSKAIVERSLGRSTDLVMCDGGILSAELMDRTPVRKHAVGLVPHYHEIELFEKNGITARFKELYPDGVVIDLRKPPLDVIREIGECDAIISSSLHGCIVADSFGIPNVRMRTSSIPGSGFKFDDYYSGFGLDVPALDVTSPQKLPTIEMVNERYVITPQMVSRKKEEMASCLKDFVSNL
ncbi:polysaccharide pyruvyl transferase family protein [Bifidobacterium simiiventris]|uniref:polysaccharide pyruvyl transferase family protein n=1 Tax=Bifidobacterium simiiventris TaxID=2834434 RepID=UPI001C59ACB7|nr:polysaccharide pyruvyl transferase family protein [Bifidobacterium simiiventris]MBW3078675.1 polysaccharide pyruvyl transferase family protein [Bifidobacterium simiiventris]